MFLLLMECHDIYCEGLHPAGGDVTAQEPVDLAVVRARVPKPEGCCGDAAWRGHLCQYHQGADDGAEDVPALCDEIERLWTLCATHGIDPEGCDECFVASAEGRAAHA